LWRVSVYRDDSVTTVVFADVKHAFMTANNTVLTIAQYAEDGSHHYINWPRERICWWKIERQAQDQERPARSVRLMTCGERWDSLSAEPERSQSRG
jgi:hypothetical protein